MRVGIVAMGRCVAVGLQSVVFADSVAEGAS